jgi:hypothetical protein
MTKQGGPENPKAKRQQTNSSNNWFISFSPLASTFLEDEHYGRIHCKIHFFSSTETFTHRGRFTQKLLHTETFTPKTFTQRSFYPQELLHTEAFMQRNFCTEKPCRAEKNEIFSECVHNVHLPKRCWQEAKGK